MSKVVFFAASLLLVAGVAFAGIINPCGSPVVSHMPPLPLMACYFACPQGDTGTLVGSGFWLEFTINDLLGAPIANISAVDFWLIDCDVAKDLVLCAGSASSNADSATSNSPSLLYRGKTTMSLTTLAVGGCVQGLAPVVQGIVLQQAANPCTPSTPVLCYQVKVRSCDLNPIPDLVLNSQDVGILASHYPPYPGPPPGGKAYDTCSDFDCNNVINSQDLARFAFHYGPPGHKCQ